LIQFLFEFYRLIWFAIWYSAGFDAVQKKPEGETDADLRAL